MNGSFPGVLFDFKGDLLAYRRAYKTSPQRARSAIFDWAMTLGFFGFLVFAIVRYGQIEQFNHRGNAVVLDGDTIMLAGRKIRLEGIDAPEFSQICTGKSGSYPCGREAKRRLEALAKGSAVECSGWQDDKYGRFLGTCSAGEVELNRQMRRELSRASVIASVSVAFGTAISTGSTGVRASLQMAFVRLGETRFFRIFSRFRFVDMRRGRNAKIKNTQRCGKTFSLDSVG